MTPQAPTTPIADPYDEQGPIRTPMLVLIFAVTVPAFFAFGFLALWLVETEVWLSGQGRITASKTFDIYASESAQIAELAQVAEFDQVPELAVGRANEASAPLGGGAMYNEGAVVMRLATTPLQEQLIEVSAAMADSSARIETLTAEMTAAEVSPIDVSVFALDVSERRNTAEQSYLEQRLATYVDAFEKGVLSQRELQDLNWSLTQRQLDAEVIQRRQQRAENMQAFREQQLAVLRARREAEQVHLEGLAVRQRSLQERAARLELRMPFSGQLVWADDWNIGQGVTGGALIATAHEIGERRLAVTVPDDVFVHVQVGTRIRFTTSVVSVYRYDYYWGEVTARRVVRHPDGSHRYELTATLAPGNHALPIEQLPLGSTGAVEIASERKSLLAQIVGW